MVKSVDLELMGKLVEKVIEDSLACLVEMENLVIKEVLDHLDFL
jgi:hypothetical protein